MASPATRHVALAALEVLACATGSALWPAPAPDRVVVAQRTHDLGPVRLRTRIVDDLSVVTGRDEVRVTRRPNTRTPTTLVVTNSPAAAAPDRPAWLTTQCGLRVNYGVQREGGGSGGEEATVRGTLRLSWARLAFTCNSQSEWGEPEGACLGLLEALCE